MPILRVRGAKVGQASVYESLEYGLLSIFRSGVKILWHDFVWIQHATNVLTHGGGFGSLEPNVRYNDLLKLLSFVCFYEQNEFARESEFECNFPIRERRRSTNSNTASKTNAKHVLEYDCEIRFRIGIRSANQNMQREFDCEYDLRMRITSLNTNEHSNTRLEHD